MPLHLDHRPASLEEFLGNEHIKDSLQTILESPDRPRTFLLHGPTGCGKTTLARIIAAKLGCDMELDYRELNISDARGIDSARDIMDDMRYLPKGGDVKVFVLDEVQGSVGTFQEALLKPLEDTPQHIVFILCTTDPHKLKGTIHTRATKYEVLPLPAVLIKRLLQETLAKEKVETFPEQAISLIAEICKGCPREALVMLNQVIDIPTDERVMETLEKFKASEQATESLARLLLQKREWEEVRKAVTTIKDQEVEKTRIGIINYCNKVLLNKDSRQAALVIDLFKSPMYDGLPLLTLACYQAVL